jgi:hypothetical protein
MQPCDVGLFQPEKYYHDKAVKAALRGGAISYNVASFLDDLMEIRDQALKPSNIISAFIRSGVYPPNSKYVISRMLKYNNKATKAKQKGEVTKEPSLPEHPKQPLTPKKPRDSIYGLEEWREKVRPLMSSPSQGKWDSFERGTKCVLHNAQMTEFENNAIRTAQLKAEAKGGSSKRKLRQGGAMTAEEARHLKREKAEKRIREDIAKVITAQRIAFNKEKNIAQKSGVEWRKRDKENREALKASKDPPFLDLLERDPWVIWKEAHPDWVSKEEEKKRKKKEIEIIDPRLLMKSTVDAVEIEYQEEELMRDYIGFPSEGEGEDNQSGSGSESGKSDSTGEAIVVISRH